MWTTARFIASQAGGDPGYPGLDGALMRRAPRKPSAADPARHRRLAGRRACRQGSVRGVSRAARRRRRRDRQPPRRCGDRAPMRRRSRDMPQLWTNLYRFEMHWPMLQYRERYRDKLPPRLLKGIEDGASITQETYRAAHDRARKVARDARRTGGARRRLHHAVVARARPDRHGSGQRDLQRSLVGAGRAGHQPAAAGGRPCAAWACSCSGAGTATSG